MEAHDVELGVISKSGQTESPPPNAARTSVDPSRSVDGTMVGEAQVLGVSISKSLMTSSQRNEFKIFGSSTDPSVDRGTPGFPSPLQPEEDQKSGGAGTSSTAAQATTREPTLIEPRHSSPLRPPPSSTTSRRKKRRSAADQVGRQSPIYTTRLIANRLPSHLPRQMLSQFLRQSPAGEDWR